MSLNIEARRAEQKALRQRLLALANAHRKATGKAPYEDYDAFEKAQEADTDADNAAGDTGDALPNQTPGMSDDDETDAYQTESAHLLLDMIQALVERQNDKQAA